MPGPRSLTTRPGPRTVVPELPRGGRRCPIGGHAPDPRRVPGLPLAGQAIVAGSPPTVARSVCRIERRPAPWLFILAPSIGLASLDIRVPRRAGSSFVPNFGVRRSVPPEGARAGQTCPCQMFGDQATDGFASRRGSEFSRTPTSSDTRLREAEPCHSRVLPRATTATGDDRGLVLVYRIPPIRRGCGRACGAS